MTTEVDIIKGAREWLSDPKRWHQGGGFNKDHSAGCIIGALIHSVADLYGTERQQLLDSAQKALGRHVDPCVGITAFNDDPERKHQDILDLFDKTLADLGGLA